MGRRREKGYVVSILFLSFGMGGKIPLLLGEKEKTGKTKKSPRESERGRFRNKVSIEI